MAATYYVASGGNDSNNGLTPATAWATLTPVNAHTFVPGDTILFNGGNTFTGGIAPGSGGASGNPITFSSYGTGVATISSAAGTIGFSAINIGYVVVQNLNFTGPGIATANANGVSFTVNTASTILQYVRVTNVNVTGYTQGISLLTTVASSGYNDVRIVSCTAYANLHFGIRADGPSYVPEHSNVYVGYCTAYGNTGNGTPNYDGTGILLLGVNVGTIEYCTGYGNGTGAGASGDGIWTSNSNAVVIQFCEAYNNANTTGHDGNGFDIDGGCTNCIIQYCYSHGNAGGGLCLFEYAGNVAGGGNVYSGNIIRYCVSENDGPDSNGISGIALWGATSADQITNSSVYNCTVFNNSGSCVKCLATDGQVHATGITLINNILVSGSSKFLVSCDGTIAPGITFSHDDYYALTGTWQISWLGVTYTTLASWGKDPTGLVSNPGLVNPGNGGTVGNPANLKSLSAYRIVPTSPMINAGVTVANAGPQDFYGDPLGPQILIDIGADQLIPPAGFFISAQITGVSWIGEPVWTVTAPWGFISRPSLMEALQQLVWKAGAQYGGRMQSYFSKGVTNTTEVGVP